MITTQTVGTSATQFERRPLQGESLARTAEAYFKEWGTLQHGYTMKDFRELDCSEGRK